MNRKLQTAALTLVLLATLALSLSASKAAASSNAAQVPYPDYLQLVPLFEPDEENNIRQIPAATIWEWDNGKYVPIEVEGYESKADYPDCYWQYPNNAHFPPNNPSEFAVID